VSERQTGCRKDKLDVIYFYFSCFFVIALCDSSYVGKTNWVSERQTGCYSFLFGYLLMRLFGKSV
jgi:hypothetical protein